MRHNPVWLEQHYGDLRRLLEAAGAEVSVHDRNTNHQLIFRPAATRPRCYSPVTWREEGWVFDWMGPSAMCRWQFPPNAAGAVCLRLLDQSHMGERWRHLDEELAKRLGGRPVSFVWEHEQDERRWQSRGWEHLQKEPWQTAFAQLHARFFQPSKPSFRPPTPHRVWSISWMYELAAPEQDALQEGFLRRFAGALRQITSPGERLFALDSHAASYLFDPRSIGEPYFDEWGPTTPFEGEKNYWFPDDLRFGLAVNWTKTRLVAFGAPLVEALESDLPALCVRRGRIRGGF